MTERDDRHDRDDRDDRGGHGRRGGPARGRGRARRSELGGSFFGRGHRAGRGDIRAAILALVAEEPMHGYQIIRELSERSGGVWSPSPGSVYPTLQLLEDEGLIEGDHREGRRVFALTDAGRAVVAERGADRPLPWQEVGADVDSSVFELRNLVGQVAAAVRQVAQVGSPAQVDAARSLLTETRRALYRLLAEEAEGTDPAPDA